MKKARKTMKLPVKKSLNILLVLLSILEAVCIIIQTAFLAKIIVDLFYGDYNIF